MFLSIFSCFFSSFHVFPYLLVFSYILHVVCHVSATFSFNLTLSEDAQEYLLPRLQKKIVLLYCFYVLLHVLPRLHPPTLN